MIFKQLSLEGCYIIEPEKKEDIRGFFARTFDISKFRRCNIDFNIVQTSISYNKKKGTIRGMHYQEKPYEENRLVQCIKGSVYDVVIDLRDGSLTEGKWISTELSDKNYDMLYIPKGFAHGFQTLEDDTIILYYMDEFYYSEYSKIIHYKSPEFNIKWMFNDSIIISDKDA